MLGVVEGKGAALGILGKQPFVKLCKYFGKQPYYRVK